MATRQPYRGDPEQKLYTLFNNFSGGMNTTDVDEAVYTHQYRLLENVELSEKGTVKNRQGFADLKIFNELLQATDVYLEKYSEINMFKVLRDNVNLFDYLQTYNSLTEFTNTLLKDVDIKFTIVGTLRDNLQVEFNTISIYTNPVTDELEAREDIFETGWTQNRPKKVTGFEVVHYGDNLYVPLGQVNTEAQGILEIKLEESAVKYRHIGNTDYYKPDAYEISNVGFNVLAPEPINAIADANTSVESIRTFWMTEITDGSNSASPANFNNPIYKVPAEGEFMLNILYTGSIEPEDLTVDMYTEDIEGNPVYLTPKGNGKILWSKKESGLIRMRIKVNLEGNKPVFIAVRKILMVDPEVEHEFATPTDMLDSFRTRSNFYLYNGYTELVTVYVPVTTGGTLYGYRTPMVDGFTYIHEKRFRGVPRVEGEDLWATLPDDRKINVPTGSQFPPLANLEVGTIIRWEPTGVPRVDGPRYSYTLVHRDPDEVVPSTPLKNILTVFADDASYENYKGQWMPYLDMDGNEAKVIKWVKWGTQLTRDINLSQNVMNISDQMYLEPITGRIYKTDDGTDIKYFRYKGSQIGDITDFEEVDKAEEFDIIEYQYINTFAIGTDEGLKKLEGLKTNDIKALEFKGRLCMYAGNTIWFSDLYKFDYVPNVNYIILPLNGDDYITRIAYFRGSYIVFTRDTIYRISGDFGQEDFSVTLINDSIGCIAPDSVRSVNNTLIFLSTKGLFTVKQNYYLEGLENVERADAQIRGLVSPRGTVESTSYDNQVWFLVKDAANGFMYTVKQYHDIQIAKGMYATTVDRYAFTPDNIFKVGFNLLSYKYGRFFIFGKGYTDFEYGQVEEWEHIDHMYTMRIKTPEYNLGYPTHVKKIKNMFIKTYSVKNTKIAITVFVDGKEIVNPNDFNVQWNGSGILEYSLYSNYNLQTRHAALATVGSPTEAVRNAELDYQGYIWSPYTGITEPVEPIYQLDNFTLGEDTLGVQNHQTHKLVVGGKGKSVSFLIEQTVDSPFAIQDIGVLHKLGKVKEG